VPLAYLILTLGTTWPTVTWLPASLSGCGCSSCVARQARLICAGRQRATARFAGPRLAVAEKAGGWASSSSTFGAPPTMTTRFAKFNVRNGALTDPESVPLPLTPLR
jgi:hypothetical protein